MMDDGREIGKQSETPPTDTSSGGPETSEGRAAMSGLSASDVAYDWVDRGIQDIPVSRLPRPDGVTGPADFDHHITHEDAVRVTRGLQVMKPLIDSGHTSEDFAAMDREDGTDYEHGRQRIFDLYYGSDPVRLDKDGDQYEIVSGRHRLFAAQELGIQTIPARVIEKVQRDSHG
jgi:hypothetical protein